MLEKKLHHSKDDEKHEIKRKDGVKDNCEIVAGARTFQHALS